MGYNLTNERIQDTFEQLVQISGSKLVDGTGSLITPDINVISSSYAVTASYAENVPTIDTSSLVQNTTFNAYTSSNDSAVSVLDTRVDSLTSATSSYLTSLPSGTISSSAQVDLSQATGTAANATSASYALSASYAPSTPGGLVSGTGADSMKSSDALTTTPATATQQYAIALGNGADATGQRAVSIGNNSRAQGQWTTAIGEDSQAGPSAAATAIGAQSDANGTGAVGVGYRANANNSYVVAIGYSAGSGNAYSIQIGSGSYGGVGAIAIGNAARAEDSNGISIGNKFKYDGSSLITLDDSTNVNGALTASNALISGDLYVNGTASFGYLQTVTGSATIIGDAFVILNSDTPTQRYAGIKVYDSGSPFTSSFYYDGQTNDWNYEYSGSDATNYGVALFGPEYGTQGSPSYPSNNTLQKGMGGHHLVDSNITDDGTKVSISTPLTASSLQVSSGDISFVPTTIKIGNSVAAGAEEVSLGYNISGGNGYAVNVGTNLTNNGTGGVVLIGRGSTAGGDYSIAMGENVTAGAGGIAIGNNLSSNASGINIGGIFQYDGSSTVDLTGASLTKVGSNLVGGGAPSVSGDRRFVFANGSSTSANDSVILGGESNDISTSYVGMFGTSGTNISSGDLSVVIGGYQHTINGGSRNVTIGGESVTNNQDYAIVLGRKSFTTPAPYTTYVANLDASGSVVISGSATGTIIDFNGDSGLFKSAAHLHNDELMLSSAGIGSPGGKVYYNTTNPISSSRFILETTSNLGRIRAGVSATDGIVIANNDASSQFYVTTGKTLTTGNSEVSGQIYSPTFAGSVASSTSSIDFDNGNFATLSLTADTYLANPSNLKSGTTYTIIIDSGSLISGHGTAWKFAGGTAPTYTDGTDVLTCVSDGTNLYATALTDFQ